MRTTNFITIILIVILALALSTSAFAKVVGANKTVPQRLSSPISLELKNVSLGNALQEIADQANSDLLYSDTFVPVGRIVSVNLNNATVEEALDQVLDQTATDYMFTNSGQIVLVPTRHSENYSSRAQAIPRIDIRGVVIDKDTGDPLPGANVIIKGTSVGAATDLNGKFAFEYSATAQKFTILVSFMGYKSQERQFSPSDDLSNIRFELLQDVFLTETIVVTGIASKRSKAIAEIAVTRIAASELTEKQSYTGMAQLVSGKTPGVNMQISSGNVGSGWRFNVRGGGGLTGSGQPVFYIDGVRIDNSEFSLGWTGGQTVSALSNLNPNDIENIEFLKGPAAAAMYGTGGSNGVVLITTKRGKLSKEPGVANIEYTFTYGTNQRFYKYDEDVYVNAKFFNKLIEPPGVLRENKVSVSGGTNEFRYLTSFSNRFEEGLLGFQNHMNRSAFRGNISAIPMKNLSIRVSSGFTWNKIRQPQMDNNIYSWNSNAFTYQRRWNNADSIAIASYETWNDSKQFIGSGQIAYTPFANFEINGGAGIESALWDGTDYRPFGLRYSSNTRGGKWLRRRTTTQYTYDLNARYSLNLFNVNLTSIVGTQILERRYFYTYSGGYYFSDPVIQEIQAVEQKADATESRTHSREAGIYWNNEFSYNNMFFWTLAVRRDYASVIGVDAPASTYPKASFALRADKFGILPSDISMLKLRVAYGETGQLPGLDDAIPITWGSTIGYNGTPGYYVQSKGNNKIKPERIKEWEFGLDLEFLNMFSLEFTHWRQNATDLIVPSRTSPSTGFYDYTYPVNVGSIEAWGFETLFQINPIKSPDYDLNVSFIWNYQTNEVKELGETDEILLSNSEVMRPGLPKYEFYTYVPIAPKFDEEPLRANGSPNPNYQKYIGVILSEERFALGNPVPDHSGSVSINFRFLKNFNLYASGEWALNNYMFSDALNRFWNYNTHVAQRLLAIKLGYHNYGAGQFIPIPEIDEGTEPLTPGTPEYIQAAWDYVQYEREPANYVKDASYFVFREFSLSYNFTDLLDKILLNRYIKTLNMGLSVRNLYKTSRYDLGFEVSADGGRSNYLSEDYNTLQHPRSISFWTKVGL